LNGRWIGTSVGGGYTSLGFNDLLVGEGAADETGGGGESDAILLGPLFYMNQYHW